MKKGALVFIALILVFPLRVHYSHTHTWVLVHCTVTVQLISSAGIPDSILFILRALYLISKRGFASPTLKEKEKW